MPQETWNAELVAVLLMMGVLILLGIIASALFIRQYRKEKKDKK
jgi:heme/copper-type cytochrome/quinol oxidase subunit 2